MINKSNNYQLSGIQPNTDGVLKMIYNLSNISQSSNIETTNKEITNQQKFVNNYNQYQNDSTFLRRENNNTKYENLRDFTQFNIEDGFQKNAPIETMLNTKYNNDTLYNNLNEKLMKESIMEYRLNIDSMDRNIIQYPDPFEYVVTFGPVANSGIDNIFKKLDMKNEFKNKNKKTNTNLKNDTEIVQVNYEKIIVNYENKLKVIFKPFIIKSFDNIKFIRLDNVVLPRFNSVIINSDITFTYQTSDHKIKDDFEKMKKEFITKDRYIPNDFNFSNRLFTDRFIQIEIKEIKNNYNLATNTITSNAFTVFPDKQVGIIYWRGNPYYAARTYKDSLLGTINRLSFSFYDSWGKQIKLDTSCIDYEIKQLMNTDILDVDIEIEDYINDKPKLNFIISKFTEIIKCFIIINFNIASKIPLYVAEDDESDIIYHNDLQKYLKIKLNTENFIITDLFNELNDFVTTKGFKNSLKTVKLNNEFISIDNYINNTIWFNFLEEHLEKIKYNLQVIFNNYKIFGFDILDKFKIEAINLPLNKYFQNHLTFTMGIYTNELNTMIDFTSGN